APGPAGASDLRTGLFGSSDTANGSVWLQRSWDAGARLVEIPVVWAKIAPTTRGLGFDATDPGDPGYQFAQLDSQVRAASAQGFEVTFFVFGAPRWAEGANCPGTAQAPTGSWRPDPAAFGQSSTALARRYSGTFPDPGNLRAALPHVRYYRVWNEPNLP